MPDWLESVFDWFASLKAPATWSDFVQVVGFPLAIGALILGGLQLYKAAQTARVQILLSLDERLSTFEDLREELNKTEPQINDRVRLRRYIAVFERVGHALRL